MSLQRPSAAILEVTGVPSCHSNCNGTYEQDGTMNGRPRYRNTTCSAGGVIYWDDSSKGAWLICQAKGFSGWNYSFVTQSRTVPAGAWSEGTHRSEARVDYDDLSIIDTSLATLPASLASSG